VILSKSFYIGSYEVKQQEWIYLMGNNPSYFKGNNLPVEGVSWFDAIDFCNALSDYMSYERAYTVNGQTVTWNQGANGYRLPTESEWEYACRAGSKGAYYNGLNSSCGNDPNLDPIAWYCYNSSSKTHEVGQKDPNTWGLYDMSGNVWEWNWDWYGTYPPGPVTDPTGPTSGSCRVPRGGSWGDYAQYCRSAFRVNHYPSSRSNVLGFRIARNAN
jgi:formylglycine-generating enzyme required for sulfatase activity